MTESIQYNLRMDSKTLLKNNLNVTFFNSDEVTENIMRRPDDFHCSTGDLMGPLGLFVQGLLAFLAFTSLIGNTAFTRGC